MSPSSIGDSAQSGDLSVFCAPACDLAHASCQIGMMSPPPRAVRLSQVALVGALGLPACASILGADFDRPARMDSSEAGPSRAEGNSASCGGRPCRSGQVCNEGKCAAACGLGLVECSSSCVNLERSRGNCGRCGQACEVGQVCIAGTCTGSQIVENVCTRYVNALFDVPSRCNLGLTGFLDSSSLAHRRERVRAWCTASLTSVAPGLALTPDDLSACAGKIERASCDVNVDWFTGKGLGSLCSLPRGKQADDASCSTSAQCQSGFCGGGKSHFPFMAYEGWVSCSTCVSSYISKACSKDDDCPADRECREAACLPLGVVGATGACSSNASCTPGLVCAGTVGRSTCTPRGPGTVGASCKASWECAAPAVCFREKCVVPVGSGGPCTTGLTPCADDLTCAKSVCTRIKHVAIGEVCDNSVFRCAKGACDIAYGLNHTSGTCRDTVGADDAPCGATNGMRCDSFAVCSENIEARRCVLGPLQCGR